MRRWMVLLISVALMTPLTTAAIAIAGDILGFTEQVSPDAQTNATEPSVAVDRADGTVYVAWQGSGTHVGRSDDGGRTFTQLSLGSAFGSDLGDVDIRVGGATPCAVIFCSVNDGNRDLADSISIAIDRGGALVWTAQGRVLHGPTHIEFACVTAGPSAFAGADPGLSRKGPSR